MEPSKPRLIGHGPAVCSTSLELARFIPHDPNGYYRELGVAPTATRQELREAYQRLNGQDSHRLTYILKQLLDPETRRIYDRTPQGSQFLDEYVAHDLERQTAAKMRQWQEQSPALAKLMQNFFARQVDREGQVLDSESPMSDNMEAVFSIRKVDNAGKREEWSYSFYQWETDCRDIPRLRDWQHYLILALGRRKERLYIAVGFYGGDRPWVVRQVGYRIVAFIADWVEPDAHVAQEAAEAVSRFSRLSEIGQIDPRLNGKDFVMSQQANFRRGAEALEEANAFTGGQFQKSHFFSLKDGEKQILRFLTDFKDGGDGNAWITVDQHQFVPTKPAPPSFKGDKWPTQLAAVCRRDPAFAKMYEDCFICDFIKTKEGKPWPKSARAWALACVREEIKEGGRLVGYKDSEREVEKFDSEGKPTGEKVAEKNIVIVNMGHKNFFSTLTGFGAHYGTVLDRDYVITRKGAELDTTYSIIPLEPIVLPDGRRYDLREPDLAARYVTDLKLDDIVMARASDDFYAKFFDTRVSAPEPKEAQAAAAGPDVPTAQTEVSEEQLKALAERVRSYQAPEDGAPAAPPAPPAAPPAQAPADTNGQTAPLRAY